MVESGMSRRSSRSACSFQGSGSTTVGRGSLVCQLLCTAAAALSATVSTPFPHDAPPQRSISGSFTVASPATER